MRSRSRPLASRNRFQFAGALFFGALVPFAVRGLLFPGALTGAAATNGLLTNTLAIAIAFWTRLSVETYPGIRRSYVILPSVLTAHGIAISLVLVFRIPYDRLVLVLGFALHVLWLYLLFIYVDRRITTRIGVVPFGGIETLFRIPGVEWLRLKRPHLNDVRACQSIVADFSADLPPQWEAFLADAALAGRIVYQHKQLAESLTGRVDLERLSENNFGSLVPVRGYFHLKGLVDFVVAVLVLPVVIPIMLVLALAIRLDSRGPAFFRQQRVGYAGRTVTIYKFRTMEHNNVEDDRQSAMTQNNDERVTRVGRTLRRLRLDELPQIFNILRWEMSWIGPRPEAKVLSVWYAGELPFYRYRHVVKPGISGWAQVNQGHVTNVGEVKEKLQFDFYYIKYFSPWLDLLIVLRTIKTVLTGFGSK